MAGHTPGPWEVKHRHIGAGPMEDELSGLGWVFVDGKGPEMPMLRGLFAKAADAHLIAAAPDLLEALEVCADLFEDDRFIEAIFGIGHDVSLAAGTELARRTVADAIRKARGGA